MTIWCSYDPCPAEAERCVVHEDGRLLPLCYQCATIYEWGQASPEASIVPIEDVSGQLEKDTLYRLEALPPREAT